VQRGGSLPGRRRGSGRQDSLRDQATAEGTFRISAPAAQAAGKPPLVDRGQPQLAD
jgi:hypothetical protein